MTMPIAPLTFLATAAKNIASSAADTVASNAPKVGIELTGLGPTSLADLSKYMRVTPITLIDRRVMHYPHLSECLQTCNTLFAAYYMQAVVGVTNDLISGIKISQVLDQLNPSRDISITMEGVDVNLPNYQGSGVTLNESSYLYQLPNFGKPVGKEVYGKNLTMEANPGQLTKPPVPEGDKQDKPQGNSVSVYKPAEAIREASALSVGKVVEITIGNGQNAKVYPITIRLATSPVSADSMAEFLASGGRDMSYGERFFEWKAGIISLTDLMFATDVIRAKKKMLVREKSGIFAHLVQRRDQNTLKTLFTGRRSYASASAIAVISDTTRRDVERLLARSFDDAGLRKTIFEKSLLMILMVIDEDVDVVTVYFRDIAEPTVLTQRDMKSLAKESGPDIGKILQGLLSGKAPAF